MIIGPCGFGTIVEDGRWMMEILMILCASNQEDILTIMLIQLAVTLPYPTLQVLHQIQTGIGPSGELIVLTAMDISSSAIFMIVLPTIVMVALVVMLTFPQHVLALRE